MSVSKWFPTFLWDFWLSPDVSPRRIHVYDVYDNELDELYHPPQDRPPVFEDLEVGSLDVDTRRLLHELEETFYRLESNVQSTLNDVLYQISDYKTRNDSSKPSPVLLSRISVRELQNYFIFLRFRNSQAYQDVIDSLSDACKDQGNVSTFFRPLIARNRLRCILSEFNSFLNHSSDSPHLANKTNDPPNPTVPVDSFHILVQSYCWSFNHPEICFGIAQDEQEYIFSEQCFVTLDNGVDDPASSRDLFFPISPTLALYILDRSDQGPPIPQPSRIALLEVGLESASDVHLRNSTVLQTYPRSLYFQSLRTVALSISSYEEFRSIPEHLDYSRLKQRCRQKFLQETVTKTLIVKGSIIVTDLTDEVVIMGDSAVAHGSFADVWKGTWVDPIDRRQKTVALKFLRQVMVKGVREKLIKRLKTEVLAWHRLCHKNVSQLFGIIQSTNSVGMVSQWCENGTVSQYLKNNPDADRLMLLTQVASGISYLHHANIIHGDLKGGNILVDEKGNAIITDFGLSKVIEEIASTDSMTVGTSFFAGSTRWMAPELILALVEDDDGVPPITRASDVYAFASVCLELASGRIPYPNRSNDHAVTVDILRGIKPCRSPECLLNFEDDDDDEDSHEIRREFQGSGEEVFWGLLEQCWDSNPGLRPSMSHMFAFLEVAVMTRYRHRLVGL